ncbi:MAG: DUF983 domain-containing protein [Rhodobacteraceae bacterium]|nr:DUF983 domain-containing protein [Paracoccaceae bacterium]
MTVAYRTPDERNRAAAKPQRGVTDAMLNGLKLKCPACGVGKLFSAYLKSTPHCDNCNEALHHHRADDAPPYFTITIVGHIIIPALLAVETAFRPELWIHMSLWVPLTVVLSLAFLPPVKGALIGLQWALFMHGFDPETQTELPETDPAASLDLASEKT